MARKRLSSQERGRDTKPEASETMETKLSAVISVDAAEYSRHIRERPEEAPKIVKLYKEEIGDLVYRHRGTVRDSRGDNLLAVFVSAEKAVWCAAMIQKLLKAENEKFSNEKEKIQFRIGIDLGDIKLMGEETSGNGVNTSARLGSLADPGGVCISATVHDQVENTLPLSYEDLGEQQPKSHDKPVHAYRVQMESDTHFSALTGGKEILSIEDKQDNLTLKQIQETLHAIKQKLDEPRAQWWKPDLSVRASIIAKMSDVLREKYRHMEEDKRAISYYIANYLIKNWMQIVLDSGTTVADIPYFLSATKSEVIVHTNNLIAALHAFGTKLRCIVLPGSIDEVYGATYQPTTDEIRSTSNKIPCHIVILAAAGITYQEGPLVRRTDTKNRIFKESLILKCLEEPGTKLVIAVDWTKFMGRLEEKDNQDWQPVLTKTGKWEEVLRRAEFVLVTKFPETLETLETQRSWGVLKKFQNNSEQGGMKLISVPTEGNEPEEAVQKIA